MAATRATEVLAQVKSEELGIVQTAAMLNDIVHEMGLAYNQQISPRSVGLGPCNRDTYGVNKEDAHALAHDIAFVGWSWGEASKATCVEEVPGGNAADTYNETFPNLRGRWRPSRKARPASEAGHAAIRTWRCAASRLRCRVVIPSCL